MKNLKVMILVLFTVIFNSCLGQNLKVAKEDIQNERTIIITPYDTLEIEKGKEYVNYYDSCMSHFGTFWRLLDVGKINEALATNDSLIVKYPYYHLPYNRHGYVLLNILNDYEGAIKWFEIASLLKPDEGLYYYNMGLCFFNLKNGEIADYFRFESDPEYDFGGTLLFKASLYGWLQIGKNETYPNIENTWVKSENIEIGTTNYAGDTINLRAEPNYGSIIQGYIDEESILKVLKCKDGWIYVEKGNSEGWLAPEHICTNPLTNCS